MVSNNLVDHPALRDILAASPNIVLCKPTPDKPKEHLCQQCNKDMGNEWLLGTVCGKCCRANHWKATRR